MNRYIDADLIEYEPMCRAMGNGMYEDCEIAHKDQIDDIPTADVRENVRGEWIDITMWHDEYFGNKCQAPAQKCSNCGEWSVGIYMKFCSHCGADMRGVKA